MLSFHNAKEWGEDWSTYPTYVMAKALEAQDFIGVEEAFNDAIFQLNNLDKESEEYQELARSLIEYEIPEYLAEKVKAKNIENTSIAKAIDTILDITIFWDEIAEYFLFLISSPYQDGGYRSMTK